MNKELADHFSSTTSSTWSHAEVERLRISVNELGVDKWETIASRMGSERSADECRMKFEKISMSADFNVDKSVTSVQKVYIRGMKALFVLILGTGHRVGGRG